MNSHSEVQQVASTLKPPKSVGNPGNYDDSEVNADFCFFCQATIEVDLLERSSEWGQMVSMDLTKQKPVAAADCNNNNNNNNLLW